MSILKKKPIRVLFQDEARFGRIDNPQKCWAKKGIRPKVHKQIIREYTYLYGAFCPQKGKSETLILPKMNSHCMNIFLYEISQRYPKEIILMVMDGAPCHTEGEKLIIPDNITILKLPPYCPQLNPAENMWDEIREKFFGNISFSSLSDMENQLVRACLYYDQSPQTVSSICNWNWMNIPSSV